MIKAINFRYSSPSDLQQAEEIIDLAVPERNLIQIFTSIMDTDVIDCLLSELTRRFPKVPIIGTSTAGEISGSKSTQEAIIINVVNFESSYASSYLLPECDSFEDAGNDMGRILGKQKIKVVLVFYSGLSILREANSETFVRALQKQIPQVTIAGGLSGKIANTGKTFAFTDNGISEKGIAFAAIGGKKLEALNTFSLSWAPIGKRFLITKAEGNRIYEIDGRTPLDLYQHYLGETPSIAEPLSAIEFPLMRDKKGMQVTTSPHTVHEDGSFEYLREYSQGEILRFGICHIGIVAEDARKTYEKLYDFKPQVNFVYSCAARKSVLQQDTVVELHPLNSLCPTSGFYAYGEYYSDTKASRARLLSHSISTLSLKECGCNTGDACPEYKINRHFERIESTRFKKMRTLHRFLKTSGDEIDSLIEQLASQANMDALTQLGNRRFFDERFSEELDKLNRGGPSLSLMLIDVDFFKLYNDKYGHVAGDSCLARVAQALAQIAKNHDCIAARYGGEEFAMILPETAQVSAFRVAKHINQEIEDLNIDHDCSTITDHITVSIGSLTIEKTTGLSSREILHHCDEHLYKAKQQGRNRTVGGVLQ
ncbi:diguanylate cyclase [Vibrio sp. JC009]|uniref:sensor domain-containing diguanylate cyclase n=1 Tax=Vibrio sp. JC009 TaxID=2912314 RepID=UPI0023AFAF39|nr:diguanylate cyclase [Vibrio sp. JC009]WED24816.1 diguanylate cyclase [Vibrio sp. JC009]